MRLSASLTLTAANSALLFRPVLSKRQQRNLREGSEQVGSIVNAGTAWVGQLASKDHKRTRTQTQKHTNRGRTRLANPTIQLSSYNSERQECDPHAADETATADLGVLSCGHEYFCAESSESSLGGYCINMGDPQQRRMARRNEHQQQQVSRSLQWYDDITTVSLMYDFCGEGAGPDDQGCTCTSMDATSFTVTCLEDESGPQCYTYYNKCGESIYSCMSYHYVLELQEFQNLRKRIYEQSQPYYERVVYTGVASKGSTEITSCQVEFNGVQCYSCQVVPTAVETGDEDSTATPVYWPCYQFDCSNTAGGHTGNTCDLDATKVFDYVTYKGCPVCDICEGMGTGAVMTQRTDVVDFSGISYSCDELDLMGSNALLNATECSTVQSYAADVCGCSI